MEALRPKLKQHLSEHRSVASLDSWQPSLVTISDKKGGETAKIEKDPKRTDAEAAQESTSLVDALHGERSVALKEMGPHELEGLFPEWLWRHRWQAAFCRDAPAGRLDATRREEQHNRILRHVDFDAGATEDSLHDGLCVALALKERKVLASPGRRSRQRAIVDSQGGGLLAAVNAGLLGACGLFRCEQISKDAAPLVAVSAALKHHTAVPSLAA
jgi:hypothetical protein